MNKTEPETLDATGNECQGRPGGRGYRGTSTTEAPRGGLSSTKPNCPEGNELRTDKRPALTTLLRLEPLPPTTRRTVPAADMVASPKWTANWSEMTMRRLNVPRMGTGPSHHGVTSKPRGPPTSANPPMSAVALKKKRTGIRFPGGGGACKKRVVLPTHRACLCKGNPKTHRRPLMYGTTPPPFVKPPSLGPPQQSCGQTTRGRGRTGAKMGAARKRGHAVAGQGLACTGVRTLCMHRGGAPRPQSKTDALSTENVPAPSLPPHCPPWPLRLACWIHGGGGAWPVREKGARAPSL